MNCSFRKNPVYSLVKTAFSGDVLKAVEVCYRRSNLFADSCSLVPFSSIFPFLVHISFSCAVYLNYFHSFCVFNRIYRIISFDSNSRRRKMSSIGTRKAKAKIFVELFRGESSVVEQQFMLFVDNVITNYLTFHQPKPKPITYSTLPHIFLQYSSKPISLTADTRPRKLSRSCWILL